MENNNKLFTEFLGAKVTIDTYFLNGMYVTDKEENLKFDKDLNLIMEVVEKAELCFNGNIDINILKNGTEIHNYSTNELLFSNVADISFKKKIEHIYNAMVWFVNWHNNQIK